MNQELKLLIVETLKEFGEIKFDLTYVTKGFNAEIEIGEKRNEECGAIYEELAAWLGYDEFIDYLISHGVQHNFNGEIFLENGEICFNLTVMGYCYEYDDSDRKFIEFEEEFITNELKIDLSTLGMDDSFDEQELRVEFYKRKDAPIERLELFNNKKWQKIELDENQLETFNKFIESEIDRATPAFDIDFECEILWEVECDEKCLEFNYWSSPIKLKLNDILSK
ncbi:MAG: hypothetical protein RL308_520 [Bacteroidota bacterium]|jgi:hypothetical protein